MKKLLTKKLLRAAVLFLLVLLSLSLSLSFLSSCTREPENISTEITDENGEVFRLANNKAVDFYFYYPENFVIDKNAAMISVYIPDTAFVESELESGVGQSIAVNPNLSAYVFTQIGSYANAEQYWEAEVKPSYSATFQDLSVESSEDITITGISGRKYIYSASVGGHEYKYAQVIFLRNAEVYMLLYTATPDKFDKHSNVLDTAVDTLAFKE